MPEPADQSTSSPSNESAPPAPATSGLRSSNLRKKLHQSVARKAIGEPNGDLVIRINDEGWYVRFDGHCYVLYHGASSLGYYGTLVAALTRFSDYATGLALNREGLAVLEALQAIHADILRLLK